MKSWREEDWNDEYGGLLEDVCFFLIRLRRILRLVE